MAVAIPNFSKFMGSGAERAAELELSNMDTAVMAYMVDNDGNYPTSDGEYPGSVDVDLLFPNYLRQVPQGEYELDENGIVAKVS